MFIDNHIENIWSIRSEKQFYKYYQKTNFKEYKGFLKKDPNLMTFQSVMFLMQKVDDIHDREISFLMPPGKTVPLIFKVKGVGGLK